MPRMQAPKGYYTATEVKEILNISDSMVRRYVQKGKITYSTPPERKQGFYLKKDVDNLYNELEAFLNLEEEIEPTSFTVASSEDIPGCIALNRELFTAKVDTDDATLIRKWTNWIQKNPEVVHILKTNNEILGIATVIPFRPGSTKYEKVIHDDTSILLGDVDINEDDIEKYAARNTVQLYIAEIGIKPSLEKDLRRRYGAKLISSFMDTVVDLGKRGIIIDSMTSVGATRSGIKLLQHFGFSEIVFPRSDTRMFAIDMKQSGAPLIQAYREALENFNKQSQ
ncbi:helix-turn-helix domain-containing protein [Tengunoibacter tsumagoiensis]|uniref:Helix-turn-helix domain-containing protein n=1 Tax=Tengunoibacter tsumagoiensis TaxID=2014871 RepID=A0A401ZZ60_9CHLR|nr:helix-turn-helix domain-containing protein [Tengunoibacter tsumagoiensis]GCE12125.1 hypothetical protein KTT_19840 [Tengunoibacter tsumagoiensis]